MQREEEGGGVCFKWRVLRKAFQSESETAEAAFVVSEAAVREFHLRRSDLFIRSSPRRGRSS